LECISASKNLISTCTERLKLIFLYRSSGAYHTDIETNLGMLATLQLNCINHELLQKLQYEVNGYLIAVLVLKDWLEIHLLLFVHLKLPVACRK